MGEQNGKQRVPDGGWAWVVCFGSFTLQALTIGITYTFGIIFVDLLDYFDSSESETAWIGSIQPCLLYFTGIVAAPLLLRFGWRAVTIAGALMSCVGFVASAFVTQLWMLYITYGVITGIGSGLMYVTSMVAVQHYFKKHRAMATGLAVSGSGVGTMIFGVVTQRLLSAVGWRYTLLFEAGVYLVIGIPVGCLYLPLPRATDAKRNNQKTNDVKDEKSPLINKSYSKDEEGPVSFYQSSIKSKSGHGSISLPASILESDFEGHPSNNCICIGCDSPRLQNSAFCGVLREIFDTSLFRNPLFVLFTISLLLFAFGYHVPFTYTPEKAILLGIEPNKASYLISIMGVSNVVARLLFGWIADKSEKIRFYFAGIVYYAAGVLTGIVFLYENYALLVTYSVLFGACSGCFVALFPVILVDLMGLDLIEKSMGQALACASLAFLLASPLSGILISATNNYNVPFMVVGGMQIVGASFFCIVKCLEAKYGYKEPVPDDQENEDNEIDDEPTKRLPKIKSHAHRIIQRVPSRISDAFA